MLKIISILLFTLFSLQIYSQSNDGDNVLDTQYSIRGEKWETINNSKRKKYPFYRINFFSDSMYAVSFDFDSVVVAKYTADNKFIYLAYIPFETKGFNRNQHYYKIRYKRDGKFIFVYSEEHFRKRYKYKVE